MTSSEPYRALDWPHGTLAVERLGAVLGPVRFRLPGGREVEPLHFAPWAPDEAKAGPPLLRRLRGEWPCVPFGYAVAPGPLTPPDWAAIMPPAGPGEEVHGYGSNHDWVWEEEQGALALAIAYPVANSIRSLRRTVRPDPEAPAIDLSLRVEARAACALPLGLHVTFRLPPEPNSVVIEPGAFRQGWTYPGEVERGRAAFLPGEVFTDLAAVPSPSGLLDATRLPLRRRVEELLQLDGVSGEASLAFLREGFRARLGWDAGLFPSLLLWISNRGREAPPWSGRHLALGLEPVRSPFGLGTATAAGPNPIADSGTPTAFRFRAGEVLETFYRLSVEPL